LGWVKRVIGARGRPGGLSDEFTGFLLDENRAIGRGAQAALGAMYMGATPEEAAQVACAVDPYCSGPITVERLG
jgi:hypothetical protein